MGYGEVLLGTPLGNIMRNPLKTSGSSLGMYENRLVPDGNTRIKTFHTHTPSARPPQKGKMNLLGCMFTGSLTICIFNS
jgi:hypothetical protein